MVTVAKKIFEIVDAKIKIEANGINLVIESIPGHLQAYAPIQVLIVDGEPTEVDVMELVRKSETIRGNQANCAGILLYREPPDALCRMKIAEVRLRKGFILIPLSLISIENALLDGDTCIGLLAQYVKKYLPGANFFDDRNAIGDNLSFFGRLELLQRLGEELKKNQSIGLFGLRKSGKTSILLQLKYLLRRHPIVYIDLEFYGGSLWGAEFFNDIIRQLSNLIQIKEIIDDNFSFNSSDVKFFQTNRPAKELTTDFSKQFIKLVQLLQEKEYNLPIFCFLDELERVIPSPEDSREKVEEFNACFGVLRALSQKYRNLSLLITDAYPNCNRINQWTQPGVPTNPVFSFFKEELIAPFLKEDTTTMITDIGKLMLRSFDEKTLSEIHARSGGHPFLARQIASLLCEKIPVEVSQHIKWGNSKGYLDDILSYSGFLRNFIEENIWAGFNKHNFEPARLVLRTLALNSIGMTQLELFSYLKKKCSRNKIIEALLWLEPVGLIEKKQMGKKELYNICIPLLTQWLEMEYGNT